MGVFIQAALFPGGEELKCRIALQRAADDKSLAVCLGGCRWHLYDKGPAVLLNDGCCGYEALAERLSASLAGPVMVLYIYDDDYWGYFLWENGTELDQFASLPDYFGAGSPPDRPGNAALAARLFGVEEKVIAPYFLPWDEEQMGSYAREGDQAVIGDSWQMADFMEALGFDYDLLCPPASEEVHDLQQAAPMAPAELNQEITKGHRLPVDTPTLPDALNNQAYALKRAAEVRDLAPEAVALVENMQYQSAVAPLSQAIQAHPDRAGLYLLRAFCWSQTEGLATGLSRKPDMDRDLGKALELEPDNVMALRARCPTAGTTARYRRHITELTRLMELDPENRDYHQVSRAYRYHWVGDDQAARADLQAVLDRGKIWTVDLTYLCQELGLIS